jgi:hypothetical protein
MEISWRLWKGDFKGLASANAIDGLLNSHKFEITKIASGNRMKPPWFIVDFMQQILLISGIVQTSRK